MKNKTGKILIGAILVGVIALGTNFGSINTKALENGYMDGTDQQFMYTSRSLRCSIAKGKEEYYIMKDGYLYAGNPENMKSQGYFLASNFLAYYDGSLYITHRDTAKDIKKLELLKVSLDGEDRETIYVFDKTPTSIAIHRGELYYSVRDEINAEGYEYSDRHILNKVKLGEQKATKLYEGDLDREEVIEDIKCYGKYIYFMVRSYKDDEITSKQMYYDTVTNTVERIHSDDDKDIVSNVRMVEDKIIYTVCNPEPKTDCTYEEYIACFKQYMANLDGSEIKESLLSNVNGTVLGDGENFVVQLVDRINHEQTGIQMYTPQGKLISSVNLEGYSEELYTVLPGDEDYLFIVNRPHGDDTSIVSVDKKKLMQGEFEQKLMVKSER